MTESHPTQSSLKQFTRGGQTLLHNIRMFTQVVFKVFAGLMTVCLVWAVIWLISVSTLHDWQQTGQWGLAWLFNQFKPNQPLTFTGPEGEPLKQTAAAWVQSPDLQAAAARLGQHGIRAGWLSLYGLMFSGVLMVGWLTWRGRTYFQVQHVRGDEEAPPKTVAKGLKRARQASDLHLDRLPLVQGSECQHLLFHGSTGTGKSNAVQQLMSQIRARGDRAIIYDKSGSFIQHWYRPDEDKILNPLDERGEPWHLWHECRDSVDYDNLAAAQIPIPPGVSDPFWLQGARTIFASAAQAMQADPERSTEQLLRYLLKAELSELEQYLKGTEAASLVSTQIEKTAVSMKAILAAYLKGLRYVRDDGEPLSIRQWVHDDTRSDWLFISSLGDRHETLRPLITAWLDIAVNALLSLSPDPDRRVWFILDELTSLHKIPYLTAAAAEARKFGGCLVLGLQSYAQLAQVYGAEGAKELSSLCNTRVLFRQPDPEMARWAAKNLGERTVQEPSEGISYGANTIRDGISLQSRENTKLVVTASQMMRLPNLHSYVRLPGDWPVTQLHWRYVNRPAYQAAFSQRPLNESSELDTLLRTHDSPSAVGPEAPYESDASRTEELMAEPGVFDC